MKQLRQAFPLLLLIFILALAACTPAPGSGGDGAGSNNVADTEVAGNGDTETNSANENEATDDDPDVTATQDVDTEDSDGEDVTEVTMYVADATVDCVGVAPQTCLQIRFDPDAEWTYFYDQIDGFAYEPGFEYELRVRQIEVADPPADGSSLRYELIEIVAMSETEAAIAVEDVSLVGTTWQWLRFDSGDPAFSFMVADPAAYTLTLLEDGTYLFQADCNSGSGTYTLSGSSLELRSGPMTLAECGPDSRYDFFVDRLLEVVTFVEAEGQLHLNLMMDAGNLVLAPAPVSPLAANEWSITQVYSDTNLLTVTPDLDLTMSFADGEINGFAGCNTYFGTYEAGDSTLALGPIGSTRMFCEGEGSQIETTLFAALSQVTGYKVDDNGVSLLGEDGTVLLVLEPAGAGA